jgi:hypothetical protein
VDGTVRIQGFTRDLLNNYKYTLTLSDCVQITRQDRLISDTADIKKLNKRERVRETSERTRVKTEKTSKRRSKKMFPAPSEDMPPEWYAPLIIDFEAYEIDLTPYEIDLTPFDFDPQFFEVDLSPWTEVYGGLLFKDSCDTKRKKKKQ